MAGRLSYGDESLLKRFFGRYQVAFERSASGGALAHAELFGKARPEWADKNSQLDVRECDLVLTSKKYPAAAWPKIVAGDIAWSPRELTAQPTAEPRGERGYEADHHVLLQYALVTRRLEELRKVDNGLFFKILNAYYGDDGARCREPKRDPKTSAIIAHGVGQLVAVYPLTEPGKRLLDASEGKTRLHLTRIERLENIVRTPTPHQSALLARAHVLAENALSEACQRWNDIASKSSDHKRRAELKKKQDAYYANRDWVRRQRLAQLRRIPEAAE